MSDVFISYSRKDGDFAKKLTEKLAEIGHEIWIDWHDIPLTANWWKEITEGIENANTFVFIISPDSVSSPICNFEVAHALYYGKRIIPILYRDVDEHKAFSKLISKKLHETEQEILDKRDLIQVARDSWGVLARHNWVFFNNDEPFEVTFNKLLDIMATDLEHTLYVKLEIRLCRKSLNINTKLKS